MWELLPGEESSDEHRPKETYERLMLVDLNAKLSIITSIKPSSFSRSNPLCQPEQLLWSADHH